MSGDAVSCGKCGWVHFPVSRAFAEASIASFNAYFETLDAEKRELFGNRRSSMASYDKCFRCGGSYKDFRPTTEAEIAKIYGSTIQPILERDDA